MTTDGNPLSNEPYIPVEYHPVYSETHQSATIETGSRRAAHSSWNLPSFSSENPFQSPIRRAEPGMFSLGQDDINRNLVSSYQHLPLRGAGLLQAPPTYTDATRSKEYYEQHQHTLIPESTISASLRPPRGVRFREASFASPPRHISQSMLKLPSQSRIQQPPKLQGPCNPAPALSQTAETRSPFGHSVQTVHGGAHSTNIPSLYQHRSSPISHNIVNSCLSHQGSLNEHFLSQHQPDYGNPLPDRMHLAQQYIMPYISSQRFYPSSHLNYQSITPTGHQPLDQNIGYQPQVAHFGHQPQVALSPQHVGIPFDNNQIRARHSSPQYQPKINHPKPATFDGSQSWQEYHFSI